MKNQEFEVTSSGKSSISRPSVVRLVVLYFPSALVPAVVALISTAIYTRVLETDDYGRYSLIISLSGLGAGILSQWLQQAINRYIPGEPAPAPLLEAVAVSVLLIATVGSGLALFVAVPSMHLAVGEWRPLVLTGAALTVSSAIIGSLFVILQAQSRAARYSSRQLINVIVRFAVSLAVIYAGFRTASALLWTLVAVCWLLIPVLWQDGGLPSPFSLTQRRTHWQAGLKRMWVYGFPMTGYYLASNILSVGDRYVIQLLRGSAEVGVYAANYSLVNGGVGLVSLPVLLALHPLLIRAWDSGDGEGVSTLLSRIVEIYLGLGGLLVGGVAVFSRDLAGWFLGPDFRYGHTVMPAVMAGVVLSQLGMYTHKALEFRGQTRQMFTLAGVSAAFNLGINLLLIPKYGYMVAAYSTLISYALYGGLAAWRSRLTVEWSVRWNLVLGVILSMTAGLFLVVKGRILTESVFGYAAGLVASVVAYCVLVALIGAWGYKLLINNQKNKRRK